jgi:glutathione S-transferase
MRTLYHYWLCPSSRFIRLLLAEKKMACEFEVEHFWQTRDDFLELSPLNIIPVMLDGEDYPIVGKYAILEHIESTYTETNFMGNSPDVTAEIRHLISYFDDQFGSIVTYPLFYQKVVSRFARVSSPESLKIRESIGQMAKFLKSAEFFIERRRWLAGDFITAADFAFAAHLSVIDYIGDVPWDDYPHAKEWYSKMKSRPTFRGLLSDRVPGYTPSPHYTDLDF